TYVVAPLVRCGVARVAQPPTPSAVSTISTAREQRMSPITRTSMDARCRPITRRITQSECPKLSEKFSLLFWREGGDDFLEPWVPAQWVPSRIQLERAIA